MLATARHPRYLRVPMLAAVYLPCLNGATAPLHILPAGIPVQRFPGGRRAASATP